jgi:Uma2 family endonuclease
VESKTANLEPHTEFLWTRADYDDLLEKGVFTSADKVELLNGKIITRSPQNARHATAYTLFSTWLRTAFPTGYTIRAQLPLALGDRSEPEPDLAVVRGDVRDYADHHPMAADTILIVEISDSSIAIDRGLKLEAYARAGIPEYWIVNLADSVLEVHRSPAGEVYKDVQKLGREDSVAPIGREAAGTTLAELLP